MTEMVELVAAALFEDEHCTTMCSARDLAHVAIKAMRNPSPDVLEAGCASHPPGDYHAGTTLSDIILAEWQAMIDKALE